MTTDARSGPGVGAVSDDDPAVDIDDLTVAYRQLHGGSDDVPTPKQFTELEKLAERLEVTVRPAQHQGTCIDRKTGRAVDPELAAELLWCADRQAWLLDAAEVHQAEVVAGISPHTGWRSLTTVQRRALASWRQRYPGLTYGTLLEAAPDQARRRLELHGWLLDGTLPVVVAEPEPVLEASDTDETEFVADADAAMDEVTAEPDVEQQVEVVRPVPVAKGPPPNAQYAESEMDTESLAAAVAEGITSPEGAKGFIRIDPYGTANQLSDAVIGYFDKVELPVPRGGIGRLTERAAEFNGFGTVPTDDLPVGQYIWFPARDVLKRWIHDSDPKR